LTAASVLTINGAAKGQNPRLAFVNQPNRQSLIRYQPGLTQKKQ
jgi:hypothetical protein